jgi:hypothetical protein
MDVPEDNCDTLYFGRQVPVVLRYCTKPHGVRISEGQYFCLLCSQLLSASTKLKYSYVCQPITRLSHPEELRVRIHALTGFTPEERAPQGSPLPETDPRFLGS